jgi:predicted RNA-binding Zn-ribbon protein involved in translation (DUF1610 family)
MREEVPECARCGRRMEPGFVPDASAAGAVQPHWIPGAPVWSRWSGLKLKGRPRLPVVAFRCPKCGRLELVARPA